MIKVSNQFEVINLNKRKRKQEIIAIGFVTLTYWFCCSTLNKSQIVINSFFKAFFFTLDSFSLSLARLHVVR